MYELTSSGSGGAAVGAVETVGDATVVVVGGARAGAGGHRLRRPRPVHRHPDPEDTEKNIFEANQQIVTLFTFVE